MKSTIALPSFRPTLNKVERKLLQQLKESIHETEYKEVVNSRIVTDDYLVRFLVYNDWNLEDSKMMFINTMKWRKEEGIDELLETFPKSTYFNTIKEYWPYVCNISKTYDGSIVVYEKKGLCSPTFLHRVPADVLIRWHIYELEVIEEERRKSYINSKENSVEGILTPGVVFIQDIQGLGWQHFHKQAIQCAYQLSVIQQKYYPESLRKMFILNAPSVFPALWRIVSKWYDQSRLEMFQIIGPKQERSFGSIIPPNQLLKEYGGQLEYDFPKGGICDNPTHSPDDSGDWNQVVVSYYHQEELSIGKNALLSWEFTTLYYDIKFSLKLQADDDEEELIQPTRYLSHQQLIKDSIITEKEGTYIFSWDNSYSWTRSKTLNYRINVEYIETNTH